MELALHMSAILRRENSPTHYRHSNLFTTQNHHTSLFPHFSKYPQFQAKNRRNWTPKLVLAATNQRLRITEQEQSQEEEEEEEEEDAEEEEEEEEYDYSEDESSLLSLSEKPDRNMALLDEYEMEELEYAADLNHRSGYVAVLGKPNVGKSTLSNQMVGQKLSVVTDKPQTTRHRILGICSGTDYQIDEVLEEGVGNQTESLPPILLVMNKKDLIKPGEIAKKLELYEKFTNVDEVIPVRTKLGQGVEDVKHWILSKLPFGPAYYPKVFWHWIRNAFHPKEKTALAWNF